MPKIRGKLGGLSGLAFADHLGRGLENPDDLAFVAGVAVKNARFGLTHHLLNQRHHLIQSLAVSFVSLLAEADWQSTMQDSVRPVGASHQEKKLIRLLHCWPGYDSNLSRSNK